MNETEIWPQFELLTRTCKIKIDRLPDAWRIEIGKEGEGDPIICDQPDLITTVVDALYRAEARGWYDELGRKGPTNVSRVH